MSDFWGVLGALATVVVPMALAGWLLGRPDRRRKRRDDAHGKMPARKDD